jgi:hypothetical protein
MSSLTAARARGNGVLVAIAATVTLVTACSAAATTRPPTGATTRPPTGAPTQTVAAASVLTVGSSIADGAALTTPTAWIATVGGDVAALPVDRVEFLIDGELAWTEHHLPYDFNDDGNVLVPSVLDPGSHQLEVDVYTAAGKAATATATVTTVRPAVPAAIAGKSFTHGVGNGGSWRYTFGSDGVIRFDDSFGSGGTEAFIALPDGTISFYGPANWIVPEDRRGGFCDSPEGSTPEGTTVMHWQIVGSNIVIASTGASEPCPGRTSNLAGEYTPSK